MNSKGFFSAPNLIGLGVFLALTLGLVLYYIAVDFRGLTHEHGMEQADIAREIARGNGYTTKTVRPLALYQVLEHDPSAKMTSIPDTYHAPLHPAVLSLVFKPLEAAWEWEEEVTVYFMDRVVAFTSIVFLLVGIGVSYLLITNLFDQKIALISAILMLSCATLWKYAQSGLAQMLMFALFAAALYTMHKGLLSQASGRSALKWVCASAVCFGLLALSHWLAVWIFFGAMLFVAFAFRPRGLHLGLFLLIFAVITVPWLVRNYGAVGDPFGIGKYIFYGGLDQRGEWEVMRNFDPDTVPFTLLGLPTKLILNTLSQVNYLYIFLGSVLVAPLFFLSLFHGFRRPDIASFRWMVLAMWGFAAIGMALFGIDPKAEVQSNNLHLLFIPVMSAYGLAFFAIMWSRLNLNRNLPMAGTAHFAIVILISILPMLLSIPRGLRSGLFSSRNTAVMNWPPYIPPHYNYFLNGATTETDVVVADAPWAVAWYGDRSSVWLPLDVRQFGLLKEQATAGKTPVIGIMITPVTTHLGLGEEIMGGGYADWSSLITHGVCSRLGVDTLANKGFEYSAVHPLTSSGEMVFYAEKKLW